MKRYLLSVLLLLPILLYGQHKCGCTLHPDIKEHIDCKTKQLKDGGKLYYQFTCDSIWLTYENRGGKKVILNSDDTTLYQYNYRLGLQFAREYNRGILFRSGCPANGPCNFVLIDKKTGKWLKEYGELIYDHSTEKFYDFVIYFSNDELNELKVEYIDSRKKYKVRVNPKDFNAIIPQYQFDKIILKNSILTLSYSYRNEATDKLLKKNIIVNVGK